MPEKNSTIHFIMTGGTIDSYYDGSKDTAVPKELSVIPAYISGLKLYNKAKFTQVCMKDSRNITEKDLIKLLNTVQKSKCAHIIITHGTYTLPDSARFLQANLKRKDQVIILTAAMLPMVNFAMSDGSFNLGYAVAKLQDLSPGIYVCMHGKVFSSTEVIKVICQGRFSSILGEK